MKSEITHQMREVLNILDRENLHLTAEDIYEQSGQMSRATVYRALDRLVESGRVHRLSTDLGKAIYEPVSAPHLHLQCRQCGQLYDIPADLGRVAMEAVGFYGHEAHQVEVMTYGICRSCLASKTEPAQTTDNLT